MGHINMKKFGISLAIAAAMSLAGAAAVQAADWEQYLDQVRIKKAAADTMTPAQLEARRIDLAKLLAHQAANPKVGADTCTAATFEIGALPFAATDTTTGRTDDFDLPADTTNPTCAAATTCTGTGTAGSLPRGAIYTGTGTGPDFAYRIRTDAGCALTLTMTSPEDDLSLVLYQGQCSSSLADCGCVSDAAVSGGTETISLTAVAGTDYFLVTDGYSAGGTAPGPDGPFTTNVAGSGCSLVPVELQSFEVN
jgi:hypothetical protein